MNKFLPPVGTVSFFKKTVIEMVVVVPHDSSNVNDPRDRIEQTYILAKSGRLVAASNVAAEIEEMNARD